MNNKQAIRVRFAPSPTGLLHLGSVRTLLFNFLYARKYNGTFILRIEDTDFERNFDPGAKMILEDIAWLKLSFDEGPGKNSPYGPYFQSERHAIYQQKLDYLIQKGAVYRCFCSPEELEKKRERQIALKQPPRYDRSCLKKTDAQIELLLQDKMPFIWRFKLPSDKAIVINDLARATVDFNLSNFSDFALTRENGTFTFLFANAIDDITMNISHIFRGEDHISNTPCQVALYEAFDFTAPVFWHMPIMCNIEGKKLSKRDFGFSLQDLKKGGYLPEAICNYLAIIGSSFKEEIMPLEKLVEALDFNTLNATTGLKYDVEKLRWVNHQWILRLSTQEVIHRSQPFLFATYPEAQQVPSAILEKLIGLIHKELKTLLDVPTFLRFYFDFNPATITVPESQKTVAQDLCSLIAHNSDIDSVLIKIKAYAHTHNIPASACFKLVRLLLTGSEEGISVKDLLIALGIEETKKRISIVHKSIL